MMALLRAEEALQPLQPRQAPVVADKAPNNARQQQTAASAQNAPAVKTAQPKAKAPRPPGYRSPVYLAHLAKAAKTGKPYSVANPEKVSGRKPAPWRSWDKPTSK